MPTYRVRSLMQLSIIAIPTVVFIRLYQENNSFYIKILCGGQCLDFYGI